MPLRFRGCVGFAFVYNRSHKHTRLSEGFWFGVNVCFVCVFGMRVSICHRDFGLVSLLCGCGVRSCSASVYVFIALAYNKCHWDFGLVSIFGGREMRKGAWKPRKHEWNDVWAAREARESLEDTKARQARRFESSGGPPRTTFCPNAPNPPM